ncbi:uncharacterized protein LOC122498502 [Leptopilina heterotoma]|uniref:uncharacterized protein LOC122498502 n=1 Tax=Leptopilina heterotoma TaxID=63436 RepID=UPI001CA81478|nr:uncharacterized protein LOC122498502 [Leptopilina heterotoma]
MVTMKLQFYKLKILILFLICFETKSNSEDCNSFNCVVTNYLQRDSEIKQVLLFVNVTRISNECTRNIPTILIDDQNITKDHFLTRINKQFFEIPRSTLFVISCFNYDDALTAVSKIVTFLTICAPFKIRPKVLIIEKQRINCKKVLRLMWSKNFLDVTVLRIYFKHSKSVSFLSTKSDFITQQLFLNPFSAKFVNVTVSSKVNLFPDKLKNLHGYPLKIAFFHYPPYVNIFRNSTGHVTYLDGFDVVNVKALAKAKNFRMVEKISERTTWPVFNCIKEKNIDMFLDLMYNEIQFIGDQSGRPAGCLSKLIELSHFYQNIYHYALVPKSREKSSNLINKWDVFSVVTFIYLLLSVWIVAKLLQFNPINWQIAYLLQLSLGWNTPNEPKRLIERIVMGSMIINCFFYSSEIYSTFTSTSIPSMPSDEIETLDDLFASNLSLHVFPNIYLAVSRDATGNAKKFYDRAVVTTARDEECIEYLLKHRNISCMIRHAKAQLAAIKYRNEYGQPLTKVLKEYLSFLPSTFYMEEGSPYVKSVEEYLIKIGEAGIFSQWSKEYLGSKSTILADTSEDLVMETIEINKLLKRNILFVLVIGCACSTLMFAGEVIFHFCHRRIQSR